LTTPSFSEKKMIKIGGCDGCGGARGEE